MRTMKRLIGSCSVRPSVGHPCTQARRTVTTFAAQNVRMVGDEQERNFRPANPPLKDPANSNFMFAVPPSYENSSNSVRDLDVGGDGYMQSNRVASSLPYCAGGMIRRLDSADEKHLGFASNAGTINIMPSAFDRGLPRDELHSTVTWQAAEAVSCRVATSFQEHDKQPHNDNTFRTDEYNIQKARIHANLWQEEIKKHFGETTSVEGDPNSGLREGCGGWDPRKSAPQDWESFDPSEDHFHNENPAKEESMMLEEFEKRRERNRIQIASFVKQHLYGRRRPVDGWKYILNNFGKDGKGSRGSALGGGEVQATTGSELEKLALKRESVRLRRKD